MRKVGWVILVVLVVLVGVEGSLFVQSNATWVPIKVPAPLVHPAGSVECESPTWFLALGWVVAAVVLLGLVVRLPFALRKGRRMRAEVERLQSELDFATADRRKSKVAGDETDHSLEGPV